MRRSVSGFLLHGQPISNQSRMPMSTERTNRTVDLSWGGASVDDLDPALARASAGPADPPESRPARRPAGGPFERVPELGRLDGVAAYGLGASSIAVTLPPAQSGEHVGLAVLVEVGHGSGSGCEGPRHRADGRTRGGGRDDGHRESLNTTGHVHHSERDERRRGFPSPRRFPGQLGTQFGPFAGRPIRPLLPGAGKGAPRWGITARFSAERDAFARGMLASRKPGPCHRPNSHSRPKPPTRPK